MQQVAIGDLRLERPTLLGQLLAEAPSIGQPSGTKQRSSQQRHAYQAELHRKQVGQLHPSTSLALPHSARRSAMPLVPPLIRLVISVNRS